jgi:hypothetical protein
MFEVQPARPPETANAARTKTRQKSLLLRVGWKLEPS